MDHWSERPEFAERVKGIYDSIAPKTWDVYVWADHGAGAVRGRLDAASARDIVARVLEETVYNDD